MLVIFFMQVTVKQKNAIKSIAASKLLYELHYKPIRF